ncbi:MAG: hypothetical protein ABFD94_15090 [Armatimonadia bacterium]
MHNGYVDTGSGRKSLAAAVGGANDLGAVNGLVTIQAFLATNPTYTIHYRVAPNGTTPGNTLALFGAQGCITHLGAAEFNTPPEGAHLWIIITEPTLHVPVVGGAADALYVQLHRR